MTSPANLITPSVPSHATSAQAIAALNTVGEDDRTPAMIDRLVSVAKRAQSPTTVNDRPWDSDPIPYTVVIANEPDCDGQTYSVRVTMAPSAPYAEAIAETLDAHGIVVAIYADDVRDFAQQQWAPRWNPWVEDDTLGTVLDHTMEEDCTSVFDHPEW